MNLNSWELSISCWLYCTVLRCDTKLRCPSGLWPNCDLSLWSDCLLSWQCLLTSGQMERSCTHKQNCAEHIGDNLSVYPGSLSVSNRVTGGNCILLYVCACVWMCAQMGMGCGCAPNWTWAHTWLYVITWQCWAPRFPGTTRYILQSFRASFCCSFKKWNCLPDAFFTFFPPSIWQKLLKLLIQGL